MNEKIYIVRMIESEVERTCHTWEEAEAYAKKCMQTHHEPAIIHEFKLINTIKLEK